MTCLKPFTSIAEPVTNIKAPEPGLTTVFKQSASTTSLFLDWSLKDPAVSATVTLDPATFVLSSKSDKKGGTVVDATISPNLKEFDATLKISPLKNNEFQFGIKRTFGCGTIWSLCYCSGKKAGCATVEPNLTLWGGTKVFGRASVSTVDPTAGFAAVEFKNGITLRTCYCPKDSPDKPLAVAGFWSGPTVTLGAGTAFKALEGLVEASLFFKAIVTKGLVFAGITRIPIAEKKPHVEVRLEKVPCQCPNADGTTNVGVVFKYEPGKVTWSAGAKLSCKTTAASLALAYTEAKALTAVLALPGCSKLGLKPTVSAAWKTFEPRSLIRPAVGIELVFGE
jgi:hypothetical protein